MAWVGRDPEDQVPTPPSNLKESSKAKCRYLHLGQGNPKHRYRLGGEWFEGSPEEDLGLSVGERHNVSQQCVLTAQIL